MTRALWNALRIGLAVVLAAGGLFLAYKPVQAGAIIIVTTFDDQDGNDGGHCSLREAVIAANTDQPYGGCPAGSGADTINLTNGTYRITIPGTNEQASRKGDFDILSPLAVVGRGPGNTIVNGNGIDRVFDIRATSNVSITNLTITGGSYLEGGGVLVSNSSATFYNVSIELNGASQLGGGMAITRGSTIAIANSQIIGNRAPRASAIVNDGVLTINNTFVNANENQVSQDGAIEINSLSGALNRIENSTISNNIAPGAGATAGVRVSNIASVIIRNVTIVDNQGKGLKVLSGGKLNISNTIIARQKSNANDCEVSSSGYVSLGHNLASDNTCNLNGSLGDVIAADAALGLAPSPAVNGAGTPTYALDVSSPAVDGGSPSINSSNPSACISVDQRYYFRPGFAVCDIGAFELEGELPTSLIFLPLTVR